MLLDCIPALVLPAPGWQVAEQAHAASAQEQRLLRLAQVHALLGKVAERERAVITLRYGLGESPGECHCHSYREIGRLLALRLGHVCMLEQRTLRKLRLALTYYTPAQAASRLGVRMRQLGQVVPPYTTRVHYRRDEVDALAAQGQKVSLAGLCQRAQVTGIVTAVYHRAIASQFHLKRQI